MGHPSCSNAGSAAQIIGLKVAMVTIGLLPSPACLPIPECSNLSINDLLMYENRHSKHPGSGPLEKQTDFLRDLRAAEMLDTLSRGHLLKYSFLDPHYPLPGFFLSF